MFESVEELRAQYLSEISLKFPEDANNPEVDKYRLTLPLTTAYKYVAQSVATINQLKPLFRKDAATKLIDIAESALQAVEKSLRRSGTNDPSLLMELRKVMKFLEAFDEHYSLLPVKEDVFLNGDDPEEEPIYTDKDGTPARFEDVDDNEITPLAMRILQDNSDLPDEDVADGDVDDESAQVDPPAGEATDATVDTSAQEAAIVDTLAAAEDEEEKKEAEKKEDKKAETASNLPKQFTSEGKIESIHINTSSNLKLLESLMRNM